MGTPDNAVAGAVVTAISSGVVTGASRGAPRGFPPQLRDRQWMVELVDKHPVTPEMTMWTWGPSDRGGWRWIQPHPHALQLINLTRGPGDGSTPNTMVDVFGTAQYIEHLLWQDLDLTDLVVTADRILYAVIDVKLIISCQQPGANQALCWKCVTPGSLCESAPSDFEQPAGSNWIENTTQAATNGISTPREWQRVTVSPLNNVIQWGGCWRPSAPNALVEMALGVFLEGYCVA
jgi:hypothetical protein